jgi:hypothetical protein
MPTGTLITTGGNALPQQCALISFTPVSSVVVVVRQGRRYSGTANFPSEQLEKSHLLFTFSEDQNEFTVSSEDVLVDGITLIQAQIPTPAQPTPTMNPDLVTTTVVIVGSNCMQDNHC